MSKSAQLYQEITQSIIESLSNGVRPWESCFNTSGGGFAMRVTGDEYQGINRFLLSMAMQEKGYRHPVWMTFNQARKLGGKVRKGEKASLSVFFKPLEIDDKTTVGEKKKIIPLVKRNMVFNLGQIDDLPEEFLSKFLTNLEESEPMPPIERAEAFIKAIPADCVEANQTPHYSPSKDIVSMPAMKQFKTAENYYSVFLHELGHWTMHKTRLNRVELMKEWSKENYAKEELVAELTAAFLCPAIGIDPLIDTQHAPYLDHYIKLLTKEPQAFLKACSQAQKAADFLRAYSEEKEEEKAA